MRSAPTSILNLLLTLLLFAHSVTAHGWLASVTVDGKVYEGNTPATKTQPSIIRPVSTWSPVLGATNPSLNCGMNATRESLVATVAAGSKLQFTWKTMMAPAFHWFHNTGPLLWYMANCGATTCDKFDSTQAKWFKISELGMKPDLTWYQADLLSGAPANVTIPSNIAPGNYLIRHEIINLGRADGVTPDITEFFPSCSQFIVTGDGKGVPTEAELVRFPGAYTDREPSIFDSAYNFHAADAYKFPGPAIAAFVSGASGSSSGSGSSSSGAPHASSPPTTPSSSSASGTATHSSASTKAASTGSCKKPKPKPQSASSSDSKSESHSKSGTSKRSAVRSKRRHSRRAAAGHAERVGSW